MNIADYNPENPQFCEFPKMGRYSREVIITEKIDGTNAQIFIPEPGDLNYTQKIYAGSRTKWIQPGKQTDNAGFAAWVKANEEELLQLGPGRHFGEWWGSGIQRGYGLTKGDKRFSLFNVKRWDNSNFDNTDPRPAIVGVVPVLVILNDGFSSAVIDHVLDWLTKDGSQAAPGFMDPEGIVIYHTAGNVGFKKTIKNDNSPKSLIE